MVFLSAHLLVTCTKHNTTEIKQTCFFSPHPMFEIMPAYWKNALYGDEHTPAKDIKRQ